MTKNSRHFLFVAMFLFAQLGHTQTAQVVPSDYEIPAITESNDLTRDLNLPQFAGKKFSRKIKVAILDNGFVGRQKDIGTALPADTQHHSGPEVFITDNNGKKVKVEATEFHGLVMARLLMTVLRKSGALYDVELHLFDSVGYKRFASAVETITEQKFDVAIYSQVWEYGGNGDGKGFINALVDKAVAAGVIWIQAAGNFNQMTRLNSVDGKLEGKDEWIVFSNAKGKTSKGVSITCELPPVPPGMQQKKCPLRITLGWNSYKDDIETGTDKDLDLFIFDRNGKVVAKADREQLLAADETKPNSSILPRELIEFAQLDPGKYVARVKVKSKNFSASQDKIRLTLRPPFSMDEPTVGENILPPADNPGVIVIGARDESHSSVSKNLGLPAVWVPRSTFKLSNGAEYAGSSSASAVAGAMAVLYLGTGTEKSQAAVTAALKSLNSKRAPVPLQTTPRERPATSTPPPAASPQPRAPRAPSQNPATPSQQVPRQPAPPVQTQQPNPQQGQGGYPPSYPPPQQFPVPQQQVVIVPQPVPVPVPVQPLPPQRYCLVSRPLPVPYPSAQQLLMGGRAASVSLGGGRAGIVTSYNFVAANNLRYPGPGEKVFVTPRGPLVIAPQAIPGGVPYDFYEVVLDRVPVCAVR